MVASLSPPLKWHGGKHYLAKRIIELMPPHLHYVEPFAGGLSVLLHKDPEGVSEVVNDLNKDLTIFWKVLQGEESFREFQRLCEATPFSELEWSDAKLELGDGFEPGLGVERAWRFFVRCRQSLAGRGQSFAPLSRNRTRRGMNEQASAWLAAVDGLPAVHARLKRVVIRNRDALEVIRQEDGEGTLFYLDPPYLPETRTAPDIYTHEMTTEQHRKLLDAILAVKGKVVLSGYPCPLYDETLRSWRVVDFDMPNNAAGSAGKRRMTERLWLNFSAG